MVLALWTFSDRASAQDGMPPLCHAAWKGDVEAARKALAEGASLEVVNQFRTPLMWAALMGHSDVVDLLIDSGAQVNAVPEKAQETALRCAVSSGETKIAARLLAAGADASLGENPWGGSLAHLAARNADPALIELLAAAHVPLDVSSDEAPGTPLHIATFAGHAAVAAALVDHGANVGARGDLGRTPLHMAAQAGHREVVQLLIARRADALAVDDLGRTPAHLACEEDHDGALEELRWDAATQEWSRSLTKPDKHGLTPLHLAAAFGHPRCIELSVGYEALAAVSEGGRTPLHWACIRGDLGCVEQVLRAQKAYLTESPSDLPDSLGLRPMDLLPRRVPGRLPFEASGSPLADPKDLEPLLESKDESNWRIPRTPKPAVELFQDTSGMSLRRGGLDLAAWSDGLVLFAPDRLSPGENLRVGRIPPPTVERVLSLCTELGFFDLKYRSEGVMHASPLRMTLRRGETKGILALETRTARAPRIAAW